MTISTPDHPNNPTGPGPGGPTAPGNRAVAIDALRGVAILGILLLNVRNFALPGDAYVYPFVVKPGPGDLLAYALTTTFAQGKFIATFAALYGAGIVLSMSRRDEAGLPAFGTFLRRSLILAGVGLAHMFLVWPGDILFMYATLGLVAFTMRRWRPRSLWLMAGGIFLLAMALQALVALGLWAGATFDDSDPSLTPAARAESWMLLPGHLERRDGGANLRLRRGAGVSGDGGAAVSVPRLHAVRPAGAGADARRHGAAQARLPRRRLVGAALRADRRDRHDRRLRRQRLRDARRLAVGLHADRLVRGRAGDAGARCARGGVGHRRGGRRGVAPRRGAFAAALAPVGRMAFTNYLSQSLLGTFVFHGWGLGYYGTGYARQLLAVLAIWAVNVLFSHLWLARFRYGPLEWLWRWATYGRRPQLRRDVGPLASGA